MGAAEILPELLTPEEVGKWLGVSRKCIYNMVNRGELPKDSIIKVGVRLRFDAVQLRAWIAEKRASSRESSR